MEKFVKCNMLKHRFIKAPTLRWTKQSAKTLPATPKPHVYAASYPVGVGGVFPPTDMYRCVISQCALQGYPTTIVPRVGNQATS